jgi:osmotically-inducible protein OsmY
MKAMKVRKEMYFVALMVAVVALLVSSVPLSASETDDRIESTARQSYVFKTYLKGDDIKVQSSDGVVTLTGTVAEEMNRALAQGTVASLPGVKSVDNKLEIKGVRAAANSDAWLSAKVKATLLFHRNVSAYQTKVSAKKGIVTLRGNASSQAQKDLTTEYANDVEDVKSVINKMTIAKTSVKPGETMGEKIDEAGESVDDASITALVKMTLLYHRSTSALNTKVETNDGAVTLSGKAKNASEKDLVTKFVKDVHGVKSVNNQMTIE